MNGVDNKEIESIVAELTKQRNSLAIYHKYYNGDHELNFSSEKFKNKFGERLQKLRDNLCKAVVNAPVSRLEVIAFGDEKQPDIADPAWDIWKRNYMPRHSKTVHREAFRCGEAFAIVWQDVTSKKVKIYPQNSTECKVWTDPETKEAIKAAKLWQHKKQHFLTIYYPDRIEKYETKPQENSGYPTHTAFIKRESAGEAWPLANPFNRVPMFHFTATECHSILEDVIPLNDALNKTVSDLLVGGEYNAIRQRFISGMQLEKDEETGKAIIPFAHDDQAWYSEETEAKFGNFADVQLDQYLKSADSLRQEIARVTGVPAHYINLNTGDFPSGEALRTAEARFISMIEDAQLSLGETWAEVMSFALEIEARTKLESHQITVQWRDASPVSLTEQLSNGLVKKQLGVSSEQILEEIGYAEADIKKFMEQAQAEREAMALQMGRVFDGGESDFAN